MNGIFKNGKFTIKLFQTEKNKGRIYIKSNEGSQTTYKRDFDILNGKIYINNGFFSDIEKIDGEIKDSTLTITASHTNSNNILNKISGTYTKTGSYTIAEILKDNQLR